MSVVKVINVENYLQKRIHSEAIVDLKYSKTGCFLVSADKGGNIALWPRGKLNRAKNTRSPFESITGVWFSEDEKWLFAGYRQGRFAVYKLPKLKSRKKITLNTNRSLASSILSGTSRPILDEVVAIIHPDENQFMFVILEFRDLFKIQKDNFKTIKHQHIPGSLFEKSAISCQKRFAVFGDELGYLYRLQLPDMELGTIMQHREMVRTLDINTKSSGKKKAATGIVAVSISKDGRLLVSTSRSAGVQIWNLDENQIDNQSISDKNPFKAKAPTESSWIRGVSFMPYSNSLILGNDDCNFEIWDYNREIITHSGTCSAGIRCIDVAPDGSQIATGCKDGSVYIIPFQISCEQFLGRPRCIG